MTRTFVPSAAQQNYFDWIDGFSGNCILEAVAGAGKTTTILEGCKRMRGRIWLGVYNTKMAKEIKEKVARDPLLKQRRDLYTSTFHSAGYSALRFSFGRNHRLEVDDKKVGNIAKRLAGDNEELIAYTTGAIKIVDMAKNRGIGALVPLGDYNAWISMIEHFDLEGDLPEDTDMTRMVRFCQQILTESNNDLDRIDYSDMVYLPIQRKLRMLQHEWVLVDEAQDTNPTRRALARKLLAPNGRLIAVGDPYQAIFGFTGADNDSLEQIEQDFEAIKLPLTITYRCPKAVVKHAQQWVSHIEAGDTAPEGEVLEIEYDKLLDMVTVNDAILCRYNKYLVNLCFKLIRAGVPAKIEGRNIGEGLIAMTKKWKVVKLDALKGRVESFMEREVRKALDKGQDDKADRITDQCETMLVLINRGVEQNVSDVKGLADMIRSMFEDGTADKPVVTLCSCHKSKGLEWDRVFLLGRSELMPGQYATQPWQQQQEINLIYVAVTRAKKTLIEVTGVKEEKDQTKDSSYGGK